MTTAAQLIEDGAPQAATRLAAATGQLDCFVFAAGETALPERASQLTAGGGGLSSCWSSYGSQKEPAL